MALIYIVEDDQNIREIESFALKNSGYTIMDFECAKDFYHQLAEKVPDCILLDIMLPDEDGLEILKKIRSIPDTRKVPIMMITAKTAELDKVKGLDLGADDYITKPFGMMEFIARVKAVLRRSSRHGDDRELRCDKLSIFPGRHQVYSDDQPVELTRKEFELLLYLMENRGIVMTRDQILCHIWGYDFDGETRTVDVHVRTLRQKLGDTGRLIETVRGVGYRMADKGGNQG